MDMLKGALRWSVYPPKNGPCMLVLVLPTSEGWKAEWTLAGKKVTQIFNPRRGRGLNLGPSGLEAEILPLRQPSFDAENSLPADFEAVSRDALVQEADIVHSVPSFVREWLR